MSHPRSRLVDAVMTLAVIAIGVSFTQVEGCGRREEMIETLAFSPDDSQIVVTKLNARDSMTPRKHYIANVSRTISWLNAANGEPREVVRQDFMPGNCGPAFHLWWVGRISVVCNPINGQLAATQFGGGDVISPIGDHPTSLSTKDGVYSLAYSKSGRFIAGSGVDRFVVWDNETHRVVLKVDQDNFGFLRAGPMAFANDDANIIAADNTGVQMWDLATSNKVSTIIEGEKLAVTAISVAQDNTLIVCTDQWVRRYDLKGAIVATLLESGARFCSISASGRYLAVAGERNSHDVTVLDSTSHEEPNRIHHEDATALAMSSDGKYLAVGDLRGQVTLIDTATGRHLWERNPPGRYRWSCTLPTLLLAACCVLAWMRRKVARFDGQAPHGDSLVSRCLSPK